MATARGSRLTDAEAFYRSAIDDLRSADVPFMIGGAYAMREYAGLWRDTKDLDVFCKAGDFPRILSTLEERGYQTEVTDANWLAKAFSGDNYVDVIFNSRNGLCPVDDTWWEHARTSTVLDAEVQLIPPEEELWTKLYVQDRYRYDGADVNHIIRQVGDSLDWERVLMRMEVHWELLLQGLIHFRFVYPSEVHKVPDWLMEELVGRLQRQLGVPASKDAICRGPALSQYQYEVDINEWGYRTR